MLRREVLDITNKYYDVIINKYDVAVGREIYNFLSEHLKEKDFRIEYLDYPNMEGGYLVVSWMEDINLEMITLEYVR